MSDQRLLGFMWLAGTVLLWLVLRDLVQWGLVTTGLPDRPMLGRAVPASSIYAAAIAAGTALVLWRHPASFGFSIETVQETRKVVWPDKQETQDHTMVVIVTSVIIALMLWGFDQVFKRLFSIILNLGT